MAWLRKSCSGEQKCSATGDLIGNTSGSRGLLSQNTSVHQNMISSTTPRFVQTQGQVHVKVMGLSLEFCVRSISPIPLEGFSLNFGHMFASVRQCAEPISQPCQLKVKVTGQGHGFEP